MVFNFRKFLLYTVILFTISQISNTLVYTIPWNKSYGNHIAMDKPVHLLKLVGECYSGALSSSFNSSPTIGLRDLLLSCGLAMTAVGGRPKPEGVGEIMVNLLTAFLVNDSPKVRVTQYINLLPSIAKRPLNTAALTFCTKCNYLIVTSFQMM